MSFLGKDLIAQRASAGLAVVGVLIILAAPFRATAQPYWVKDVGGIGNDAVADVKVDTDGSIYMIGEFGGTMTFGSQTYSSAGSIDVFVAKLDPAGGVLWFITAGGTGIDRGLKLALGNGSLLSVTGEFLGTATFQGQTITSVGGTADMFVAVLDKSDGELQWIRQGGGGTGTDRPYGVSLAADGRVSVAGEFRGSATWSGNTITSAIDPDTGQPDSDVFIATYSPDGDLQWLKQGMAPYADRAIDLVHDPAGNLYVTGQFSDAITFDQTHVNTLMNASFIVRLDQDGNEVWFKHMGGGGFNHVRDMLMKPDGRLALVGDLQGTMIYFGTSQTNVSSGEPYAYYLLDVDLNGDLQGNTTVGSTSGVSAAGLSLQGNDLAVVGQFNCRYSDLSALYGEGVFMAVGPEDLFVSRHQATGLGLQEAQHFGGRSAKSASAIAHLANGEVVFTGSYQGNLIFPAVPGMLGDVFTGGGLEGNGIATYCDDENYGEFVGNTAAALTDGFIARGYVPGREPYDWWRRTDSGCDRVELEPCIRRTGGEGCPDEIHICGSATLTADLRFSSTLGQTGNFLGPSVEYLWSSGSTAPTIGVAASGTYWVRITSTNGCWQWTDTIEVTVDPAPQIPLISDDVVLNTAANGTEPIIMCDPETHWVWTPNGASVASVYWLTTDGSQVSGDSVRVDTTGTYTVVFESANGCVRQNTISVVDHPSIEIPELSVDLAISFPGDKDGDDTLSICPGQTLEFHYVPTWTVNGAVADLPEGLVVEWGFDIATLNPHDGAYHTLLSTDGSGWLVTPLIVMVSNDPCGLDSVLFYRTDSIYVDLYPTISTDVTISGPSILCDGESAVIVGACSGCEGLVWNGQDFLQLSEDSILVNAPGTYSVQGAITDPNGCSFSGQASLSVTVPTGQVLSVSPGDGIICPGQSATLSTTTPGTEHVWYGPEGPITGQGGTLVTNVPGDYYLIMTVSGCSVTSNSATLFNYGTPYLDAAPRSVLCSLDDEVELQIVATTGSVVEWQSPLSGSSLTQTIDTPGIYSCSVEACGITNQLSIEVTVSIVEAELNTLGPYTVCNGDSVLLQGAADQPLVYWQPGASVGPSLWVSATGSYYMVAEDAAGCADSTAVVQVTAISFPDPVSAIGGEVCAGDGIQLSATGSGTISWFSDEAGTQLIGTGPTLSLTPASSMEVYLGQSEAGCVGSSTQVHVEVFPRPEPLAIEGPTVICEGSAFELSVPATGNVVFTWNTPGGPVNGPVVSIATAELDDAGTYTCVASLDGCRSPAVTAVVNVFAPEPINLPTSPILCTGGAVLLAVPSGFTQVQWTTGSTTNAISVTSGQNVGVTALDPNGCASSAMVIVEEEECEFVIPNVFTPNGDGINETWLPQGGFVSADSRIYNRWGDIVFEGDMVKRAWSGKHYSTAGLCSEGVYYYIILFTRADGSSVEKAGHVQLNR